QLRIPAHYGGSAAHERRRVEAGGSVGADDPRAWQDGALDDPGPAEEGGEMTARPARVLLIGFQDQDNLGLGYLTSSLKAAGHEARIESFGADVLPLLRLAREWEPDIIGFSMIFQFMAPDFAQIIRALRAGGVTAHFTMGGHYASFAPETLLQLIPQLDSVVRFEGERTLVELTAAIVAGRR